MSVHALIHSPTVNPDTLHMKRRGKITYDSIKENYITHCLLSWQEMSQGHSQGLCLLPLRDWEVPWRWVQAAPLVPWLASEDHLDHQTLEIK